MGFVIVNYPALLVVYFVVLLVPSFTNEWFWQHWKGPHPFPNVVKFMKDNYRPDFTYADFASQFNAEFYDPNKWVDIFNSSGAK